MHERLVSNFIEKSGFVRVDKTASVSLRKLARAFRYYTTKNMTVVLNDAALVVTLGKLSEQYGGFSFYVLTGGYVSCRGLHLTAEGEGLRYANDVVNFLEDKEWCEIDTLKKHSPHLTYRVDFYNAYVQWCTARAVDPASKSRVYANARESELLYAGTDAQGRDLLRGLRLLKTKVQAEDDEL